MLLNQELQIFLIICSVIFFLIVLNLSVKKKIEIRYSILWFILSILFILMSIFPNTVMWFSELIKIREPIHAVVLVLIAFILLVIFTYNYIITKIVSQNRMLIQELGIVKKRIADLENKNSQDN